MPEKISLQNRPGSPLAIVGRSDLHVHRRDESDRLKWVVKDPVRQMFFELPEAHCFLLGQLDGTKSLLALTELMRSRFLERNWETSEILTIACGFLEKGLAFVPAEGKPPIPPRRDKSRRKWSVHPLYLRLPGFDPARGLNYLAPWTSWLFSRPAVAVVLLLALIVSAQLLLNSTRVWNEGVRLSQQISPRSLFCLWLSIAIAKAIHELGHAVCSRRFGADVTEMGIAFVVFSPCLYCNVSESAILPKRQRIYVGLAGMYAEVLIGTLAAIGWMSTQTGFLHEMCFHIVGVTFFSTFFINLNPLLKFDGYFFISDFMNVTNLKETARRHFWNTISGALSADNNLSFQSSRRERVVYSAYHIASGLYTLLIITSIFGFLQHWLRPMKLEFVAYLLLIQGGLAMGMGVLSSLRKTFGAGRELRVSRIRLTVFVLLCAASLYGVFTVPLPYRTVAPLIATPAISQKVMTAEPGEIVSAPHPSGQRVAAGEVVAELANVSLDRRLIQLNADEETQRVNTALYRYLGEPKMLVLSEQLQIQLENRKQELHDEKASLLIRAVTPGLAVAAIPPAKYSNRGTRNGVSLADGDVQSGRFLSRLTPLLHVLDPDTYTAMILIDEDERSAICEGQQIRIRLLGFPDVQIEAVVESISAAPVSDDAPDPQAQRLLATKRQLQSSNQRTGGHYIAHVRWARSELPLVGGLMGEAVIVHAPQTIAQRIARNLWSFYFAQHQQ